MDLFGRYLTIWVGLCMGVGVLLGHLAPGIFQTVAQLEYAHVNLVVAVLIWIMIYPMMVQVDFGSLHVMSVKSPGA